MNISWRQLLAPFVGAITGFLASKGLALSPTQADVLTGLLASAAAGGWHLVEVWLSKPPTLPPPDPTASRPTPKAWLLPLLALLAAGATTTLSACAGNPIQSTDEGLYAAYGLYGTVEELLAQGVTGGWLSKPTAVAIDAKAATARVLLDTAKSLEGTDPANASQDLSSALTVLQALQTQLNGLKPAGGSSS